MSLQTRIEALLTAIGADVKTLSDNSRKLHVIPVGWWAVPQSVLQTGAAAQTAGQAGFTHIDLPSGTYDSLAASVTVAQVGGSASTTLALYPTDPVTGFPDTTVAPLIQGTILTTATGSKTTTAAPVVLAAGRYWTCHLYLVTTAPTTAATLQCNVNNIDPPPSNGWRTPNNYRGWVRTSQTALPTTAFTTSNIAAAAAANVAFINVHRSA